MIGIIIMAFAGVGFGTIFVVAIILLFIFSIIVLADNNSDNNKPDKSLDSYYRSTPDNHRINMGGKSYSSTESSSDDYRSVLADAYEKIETTDCNTDYDDDDLDDGDLDDDDDWIDEEDDDNEYQEENPMVDKDLMLTRDEYHNGKVAINRLIKLIKRMSRDTQLRTAVIGSARDKDTVEGGFNQENFYTTLQFLLANDIIYCYENLGLDTEMYLYTPENQLLLCFTLELTKDKEINNYTEFRKELLSTDPIWEALRDTHEKMYIVFRDQKDVKVTAEGVDEFQLVMLVKSVQFEYLYLSELRHGLYQLAETIADAAGMNDRHRMILESFRLREEEDKKELKEKHDKEQQESEMSQTNEPTATIEDLNELIGLQQVKTEVRAMTNFIEVNRRRELAGMKTPPVSYHCVFTGNPGTGKTTVARIVAGIYKELGILQKGHLVETDRSGLVAEYVGQTAMKTNKVIDTALEGVLFIDEAYSLVGAGNEDFGKEAIATLVKRMEDDRDRLVVILAGYENEMQQFIESNPGLRSRFNRYIHFEDYSADELKQIYLRMLQKYDFALQPDAEEILTQHFYQCVANKGTDFGNARYVRNLFERTIKAQAVRLADQPENDKSQLALITSDDISMAIADNP